MKRFFLPTIVACLLFLAACISTLGNKLAYGNLDLYYKDGVTEAEAKALGKYLVASNFDNNTTHVTAQIVKSLNVYQFRLAVNEGAVNKPHWVAACKLMAAYMSKYLFNGAPVEFHACDKNMKTMQVFF
jgi:hypothetical protein